MENLIIVFVSSALVSGVISLVLGHLFENRRYIRNKKISIYSEFLEQLDKIISEDLVAKNVEAFILKERFFVESARLEKFIWKIKLISQNDRIKEYANKIFQLHGEISEQMGDGITEAEFLKKIEKGNRLREELIDLMQKDINKIL